MFGQPNIYGRAYLMYAYHEHFIGEGVFSDSSLGTGGWTGTNTGKQDIWDSYLYVNANKSNARYTDNGRIQPLSLTFNHIVKY